MKVHRASPRFQERRCIHVYFFWNFHVAEEQRASVRVCGLPLFFLWEWDGEGGLVRHCRAVERFSWSVSTLAFST